MITIKQVLDKSIHKFCMWHILKKVLEKVVVKFSPILVSTTDFNHAFGNGISIKFLEGISFGMDN